MCDGFIIDICNKLFLESSVFILNIENTHKGNPHKHRFFGVLEHLHILQ